MKKNRKFINQKIRGLFQHFLLNLQRFLNVRRNRQNRKTGDLRWNF